MREKNAKCKKGLILCREEWALVVNVSGNLCRKDRFLSSTAAAKPQEHQNLHKKIEEGKKGKPLKITRQKGDKWKYTICHSFDIRKKRMNIRKGQTDRKQQFFKMKYKNQTLSSPNILAPGVKSLFFVKGKVQN